MPEGQGKGNCWLPQCRNMRFCIYGIGRELMLHTYIYDDLASQYADQIEPKVAGMDAGELALLLTNYMPTAHDQCMPSGRLGGITDSTGWSDPVLLCSWPGPLCLPDACPPCPNEPAWTWSPNNMEGNVSVKKSDSPFAALFTDQALEQMIKELKGVGHRVDITQNKVSYDRVIITLPHITSIVNDWLCRSLRLNYFPFIRSALSVVWRYDPTIIKWCTEAKRFHSDPRQM